VPLSEEKERLALRIEAGERIAALAKETGSFGNRRSSGAPPIGRSGWGSRGSPQARTEAW
jgi:hypothetical protein